MTGEYFLVQFFTRREISFRNKALKHKWIGRVSSEEQGKKFNSETSGSETDTSLSDMSVLQAEFGQRDGVIGCLQDASLIYELSRRMDYGVSKVSKQGLKLVDKIIASYPKKPRYMFDYLYVAYYRAICLWVRLVLHGNMHNPMVQADRAACLSAIQSIVAFITDEKHKLDEVAPFLLVPLFLQGVVSTNPQDRDYARGLFAKIRVDFEPEANLYLEKIEQCWKDNKWQWW
ncbi:hypothetical protein BDV29DRAFT_160317 [Aspergillus leporis]|uniref:Uncharacterized protein n=1 Tax=Aspergillus leporis TaxID=41062 RepID=A0A5N5WQ17_9EURO|nr:hypothetical protein BDV29DRAFT_160317 [Aspergillus leporis]